MTAILAITDIRDEIDRYTFRATNEATLQDQVVTALEKSGHAFEIEREVRCQGGRFDVVVIAGDPPVRIVLELKLHSAPAPVERQAQRYALMPDVDAVGVVTTSRRLAHGLTMVAAPVMVVQPDEEGRTSGVDVHLGGKPFFVIALRTT